tara:strand:+ start:157 stop:441 length:285 start_codon:yes stop_codon:yes gene_type:complete
MACVLVKIHKNIVELELCLFRKTFKKNEQFFLACARKAGLSEPSLSGKCGEFGDFCIVDIYCDNVDYHVSKNEIAARIDKFIHFISKKFQIEIQ